jgi:hypothetical protein
VHGIEISLGPLITLETMHGELKKKTKLKKKKFKSKFKEHTDNEVLLTHMPDLSTLST